MLNELQHPTTAPRLSAAQAITRNTNNRDNIHSSRTIICSNGSSNKKNILPSLPLPAAQQQQAASEAAGDTTGAGIKSSRTRKDRRFCKRANSSARNMLNELQHPPPLQGHRQQSSNQQQCQQPQRHNKHKQNQLYLRKILWWG